eukprot:6027705-Prymnesium_polylepis.1
MSTVVVEASGGTASLQFSFSRTPTCVLDATCSSCTALPRPARLPARLPRLPSARSPVPTWSKSY